MPIRLLFVFVIALVAAIPPAQAQQAQPGLVESLGSLLKPKDDAPAREAIASATPDASRNLAVGSGRRVALVIGNAAYPGAGVLKNPANDATDIAAKLKKLGFDVTVRTDMPYRDMLRALTDFGDKVQTGTEALFFYAGHGMQVRGKNYLIPIDAQIRSESAVSSEAVDVDQLLDKLALARLSMVILDACRNNPFERRFRGSGQGLASINAPTGTLIAYATAPGKVAADGEGRNGLYTQELLAAMDIPGIKIEDVFKRVRGNVVKKSNESQTPWESSSLTGDFYFAGGQLASLGPQIVGARTKEQIEDELWDAIKGSEKTSVFEAYLREYPNGRYIAQARVRLSALKDGKPAEPPRIAVPLAPTPAAVASSDPETALWSEVQKGHTVDDYEVYLKQYPKGRYVALAKQRVQKLKDEARHKAEAEEQSAWQTAESAQTPEGYAAYLASHPAGRYAALAQTRANKLKADAALRERQAAEQRKREQAAAAQREEDRHWLRIQTATDSASVQGFIDQYPAGRYIAEARSKLAAALKEEAEMRPGNAFKDCADCPEMVIVPGGGFEMGSNSGDSDERPLHSVRIGKPFAIGRTEVTQGQWKAVMGSNPSHFSNCGDDCPVEKVSWNDAQEFVRRLSQRTGKSYRLPSEAEWEYACRAGGGHTYCGSDSIDSVAWHNSPFLGKTHPVAGKQPNTWGLYDMSGNVWEWTEDCSFGDYNGAPGDGSAWTSDDCGQRVRRGGSWVNEPRSVRAAYRKWSSATGRGVDFGFRVARRLP